MAIVSTYGTVENFTKSALLGLGATETDANGRFYLDGNMVNAELSNVIAEAIYIEEIFRDGQSVTGKYTTDRRAGAVRVMLDTPLPHSSAAARSRQSSVVQRLLLIRFWPALSSLQSLQRSC
jgi:hypothetical protein